MERTSVSGAGEHQRRVGELFGTSKQNLGRDGSSEVSESLKQREEFLITSAKPGECSAQLPAMATDLDQSHLSPSAEHRSLQACDDSIPRHPPRALLRKRWPYPPRLAKQAPPSCVSEGPVKDRTGKEDSTQTNKLKSSSGANRAPDSFEMEEVSVVPGCSLLRGLTLVEAPFAFQPSFNPFICQLPGIRSYCFKLLFSVGRLRSFWLLQSELSEGGTNLCFVPSSVHRSFLSFLIFFIDICLRERGKEREI